MRRSPRIFNHNLGEKLAISIIIYEIAIKLKNEIDDICKGFDERMEFLFKRKLEYDYRICE